MTDRTRLHADLDIANDKLRDIKRQYEAAERELATLRFRLHAAMNERDRVWGKIMASMEADLKAPAVLE